MVTLNKCMFEALIKGDDIVSAVLRIDFEYYYVKGVLLSNPGLSVHK